MPAGFGPRGRSSRDPDDRARSPPAFKAGPGRDVGEVGEPEDIRPWRLELAVDVIQRAWRGLVADRGFNGFAADDPLQTHVPHQSRHRATGNIEALALELSPDLAHAIDPEILIEDAPNLDLQRGILPGAGRQLGGIAPFGHMAMVRRGGDRQNPANPLEPMRPTMIVDEGDHGFYPRGRPPPPKKKTSLFPRSLC